ncbi:MAG: COG3650 family protein [Novosphingobium sp.]
MTGKWTLCLLAPFLAAASPASAKAPSLPGAGEAVHMTGTEPFWSADIHGRRMVLAWPENEKGVAVRVARRQIGNRLVFAGTLIRHPHFMSAGRFTITLVRASCSDGMSDRTFPYDVTIASGGTRTTGCAYTARRPYREDPVD